MTILLQEQQPLANTRRDVLAPGSANEPSQPCTDCGLATEGRACEMQHAYRSTGGIISGDELAQRLRCRSDQPISLLARWIVTGRIVHFEWRCQTWIPLFQFNLAEMDLVPGVHQVVAELRDAFDDWELTQWFARPNCWLRGGSPSEVIEADPQSVFEVARADRFVAMG